MAMPKRTLATALAAILAGLVVAGPLARPAEAASVQAAVAANFTKVAEQLAADFTARTGDEVILSFGASGALYAQISQGAPFDIFLSADQARPAKAVEEGLGVEGSVFTYALGRLALYGPGRDVSDGQAALAAGDFAHLAVADPRTAPYGAAAQDVLDGFGLAEALAGKIVTGENISQALQFVETGNAELGFVAAAQVLGKPDVWIVPAELHTPIAQDAVLLRTGQANPAARAFLDYLRSPEAVAVIEAAGYSVP